VYSRSLTDLRTTRQRRRHTRRQHKITTRDFTRPSRQRQPSLGSLKLATFLAGRYNSHAGIREDSLSRDKNLHISNPHYATTVDDTHVDNTKSLRVILHDRAGTARCPISVTSSLENDYSQPHKSRWTRCHTTINSNDDCHNMNTRTKGQQYYQYTRLVYCLSSIYIDCWVSLCKQCE
jgi:hypothetical protein